MYSPKFFGKALSLLLTSALLATTAGLSRTQAQTTNTSSTNNTRKIANSIKYSDKGATPATGRAGSATISLLLTTAL